MKIKTKAALFLCLFLLASFFSRLSYAQESVQEHSQETFQFEILPEYQQAEDKEDNTATANGVTGRMYFAPVNLRDHPYAEAAFLERIGSVELFYGSAEFDFGYVRADGPTYGATLVLMKPGSPIFVAAHYAGSKLRFDAPLDGTQEGNTYALRLGGFLGEGFLLSIGYAHHETDLDVPILLINDTIARNHYELVTKYVKKLARETAFNLEGFLEVMKFDDGIDNGANKEVFVFGDYYFTRALSLGGGFGLNRGDDKSEEGKTWLAGFNAYLSPKVSLNGTFRWFKADDDAGVDDNGFIVGLLVRI